MCTTFMEVYGIPRGKPARKPSRYKVEHRFSGCELLEISATPRPHQALVGRQVLVTPRQGEPRQAAALGINDEWKLIVRFTGESRPTALNSGEVSVRLL